MTRQLDRAELRIPVLWKRHAEALAASRRITRAADFDDAVASRLTAAQAIDRALAALGPAFRDFRDAGHRFASLGIAVGSTAERDLLASLRRHASEFGDAVGVPHALMLEPARLTDLERDRWRRVRDAGSIHDGRTARAIGDRSPPVEPVAADELERLGRYGRPFTVGPEEDSRHVA